VVFGIAFGDIVVAVLVAALVVAYGVDISVGVWGHGCSGTGSLR
jgi:hypothetical protein